MVEVPCRLPACGLCRNCSYRYRGPSRTREISPVLFRPKRTQSNNRCHGYDIGQEEGSEALKIFLIYYASRVVEIQYIAVFIIVNCERCRAELSSAAIVDIDLFQFFFMYVQFLQWCAIPSSFLWRLAIFVATGWRR